MTPAQHIRCDCPMSRAGMIEHSPRLCAVVQYRRLVVGIPTPVPKARVPWRRNPRRAGRRAAA